MPETTLSQVTAFITSHATDEDLARVQSAITVRRQALAAVTAATLHTGSSVRLDGLRPKYLNGLTGEIQSLTGTHATLLLDETSTIQLRYDGVRRWTIPQSTTRYALSGIPLACCKPQP